MDFSKIKEWLIPEGKVKSVSVGGKVLWQDGTAEPTEQLTAPTISLSGDTLTMTATDENTEEFVIFVDGVETATVEVPKEETYTVSGTWRFNDIPKHSTKDISQGCNFTIEDGRTGTSISIHTTGFYIVTIKVIGEGKSGYSTDHGWDSGYQTITFDGVQTVSQEFYDWFTTNAVKQKITFTIDGTSCQAESGMTWGDWIESEYNTSGFSIDFSGYVHLANSYYVHKNGALVNPNETITSTAYTLEYVIMPT